MSDLVLYNYFRSSTSYRARIALHFKELSFEYRPVHLLNNGGEQHKPEYRNLNPAGEVPTLIHGKHVIGQSMAIIQYLDEAFPEKSLFPKDPASKAKVLQFCENINCTHPYQNLKTLQYLEKNFQITADQKTAWVQHWMHQCFTTLEKTLQQTSGKFCFSDQFTAADAFLIPQLFSAQRFQVTTEKYPTIEKIQKNCESLNWIIKAHPKNQIDSE